MEKFRTGIDGLDAITEGGLPTARTTLIVGGAGCGKTLFLLSILYGAALKNNKPAVFVTFEERPVDIIENATSIGLDLQPYVDNGLLRIDYIGRPSETVTEVGSYSLDGLLMRIDLALTSTGAEIIAIDTIEALFSQFADRGVVRRELVRLFNSIKDRQVTALFSGEQGTSRLTRQGLEEYISDCVIALENAAIGDVTTRRLVILKYRGASHATNKFPFLIDSQGISIMPLTTAVFDHKAFGDRIPTGITELDSALDGGIRRASTFLFSGSPGTGKTILAASIVAAACARGERGLFLSFEESPDELTRNVEAAAVDLHPWIEDGRLKVISVRPALQGLERHLVELYRAVRNHKPAVVVVDPATSLSMVGDRPDVFRTLVRMIDFLKRLQITTILTMEAPADPGSFDAMNVSSVLDTWVHLTPYTPEDASERTLRIIKSRGMDHEYRFVPFTIGRRGVELKEPDDA